MLKYEYTVDALLCNRNKHQYKLMTLTFTNATQLVDVTPRFV